MWIGPDPGRRASAAQYADRLAGIVEPLGHHADHIGEQRMVELGVLMVDAVIGVHAKGVEDTFRLSPDGGASHPLCDQPHLADRGVKAETAHAMRVPFADFHDAAHPAFEDEMHAIRRVALRGNDVALVEVQPLAIPVSYTHLTLPTIYS